MQFEILNTSSATSYANRLIVLIKNEWDDDGTVDSDLKNANIPKPLVAIDQNKELVGGLAFTLYANPRHDQNSTTALWINAVLVLPKWRRQGLARKLITQAENSARHFSQQQLFVYTHLPDMYIQLGWQIVKHNDDNFSLVKQLT